MEYIYGLEPTGIAARYKTEQYLREAEEYRRRVWVATQGKALKRKSSNAHVERMECCPHGEVTFDQYI